jgi:hypothetical protein
MQYKNKKPKVYKQEEIKLCHALFFNTVALLRPHDNCERAQTEYHQYERERERGK